MASVLDQLKAQQRSSSPVKGASFEQQVLALDKAAKTPPADHEQPPHVVFAQYAPLINREVTRWAGSGLPRVVLEAEAKRLVAGALPSYNPAKNTTLGTHLGNHLQKLDAFVNTYKPDVRMSLDKTYMRNKAIAAQTNLRLELGTEPTQDQIAARLGVSATSIGSLHKQHTNLYSAVEEGGFAQPVQEHTGPNTVALDFLHHDLSPTHQVVFAHTVGYNGAPVLTAQELGAKLSIAPARVQSLRTDIARQMQRYNHAVGSLSS